MSLPMSDTGLSIDPRPMGEILVSLGHCSAEAVRSALEVQAERGGLLGELLVGSGQVTSLQVVKALGAQFGMDVEPRVEHDDIDPPAALEKRPNRRVLLEALELLERRQERILVVQADHEPDRNLIVLKVIQ